MLRILLIEDNPGDARLIEEALREIGNSGFEIVWKKTLAAGLESLNQTEFSVILLDLTLPDSNGLSTVEAVHREATDTPILVLTGLADKTVALNAVRLGAQDFLEKGAINSEVLERSIRYSIERHQSAQGFRRVIESNADGMVVVGNDETIRFVNPAALKLLGKEADELVGEKFDFPMTPGRPTEVSLPSRNGNCGKAEMNVVELNWEGGESAYLASLRDITERKEVEQEIQRNYDTQKAITALVSLMLEDTPLDELLQKALDQILSVPWLAFEYQGCIMLVDKDPEMLVMKAQNGHEHQSCQKVPFGKCLCGRAASSQEIQFADAIDDRHDIRYDGLGQHGHYCVPVLYAGKTLGVINVHLREGHICSQAEIIFLSAVANTLASIVTRKQTEIAKQKLESRYHELVEKLKAIVWEADAKTGRLTFVSQGAEELLGYPIAELMNEQRLWNRHVHEDDRDRVAAQYDKAIEERRDQDFEYRMLKQDGSAVWLRDVLTIESNGEGPVKLKGVMVDITALKQAEEELKDSLSRLESAINGTAHVLTSTIERRDPYTAGHQQRVAQLGAKIAQQLGVTESEVDEVRMAGLLHDLGKIYVPIEILSRPGSLTEVEFSIIKTHPQVGHDILKPIEFPWPIAEIILQHHERINGSGYPQGLVDYEILMPAKILGVADVVEAISSHRPYRETLGVDKALEEISKNAGILYDKTVVEACLVLFNEKGFQFD